MLFLLQSKIDGNNDGLINWRFCEIQWLSVNSVNICEYQCVSMNMTHIVISGSDVCWIIICFTEWFINDSDRWSSDVLWR